MAVDGAKAQRSLTKFKERREGDAAPPSPAAAAPVPGLNITAAAYVVLLMTVLTSICNFISAFIYCSEARSEPAIKSPVPSLKLNLGSSQELKDSKEEAKIKSPHSLTHSHVPFLVLYVQIALTSPLPFHFEERGCWLSLSAQKVIGWLECPRSSRRRRSSGSLLFVPLSPLRDLMAFSLDIRWPHAVATAARPIASPASR